MSMGFKEWAVVCEALGDGRQTVIVRKGGIAEGRKGFRFQHPEFSLVPTWFHEQVAKTRLPVGTPMPEQPVGSHRIRWRARVAWTAFVDRLETALALAPFHVLSEQVIRERFYYDDTRGLHVALVRVERLAPPYEFPDAPRYGGCRSWVEIPEPPADVAFEPVLEDAAFADVERRLREVTGGGVG
jgi:hypothetical protein